MKSQENTPENNPQLPAGPRYWRSLDEVSQSPGFQTWLEREFPAGAAEAQGLNRRHFLKIMAASFGLAGLGLAGCRQPKNHILPYAKQDERVVPGVALYYASSMPMAKEHVPIIVETHESRPTKIEGNNSYKPYNGGTDTFTQASILDLYDPDRAVKSKHLSDNAYLSQGAVSDLLASVSDTYKKNQGAGLAVLAEPSSSPTRERLIAQFKSQYPRAFWVEHNPLDQGMHEKALKALYGRDLRPSFHFDKAKRVLSFEADFLNNEPANLAHAKGFSDMRRVGDASEASKMARLYMVESGFSQTGGMADHRLRMASSHIVFFAAAIASEVVRLTGGSNTLVASLKAKSSSMQMDGDFKGWIEESAKDIVEHRGHSLAIAGSHLQEEVHQLVFIINEHISALGNTVDLLEIPSSEHKSDVVDLVEHLGSDSIDTLLIIGGNPVYDMPGKLNWAQLQQRAKQTIHFSTHFNETSKLSDSHIALSHYLESWSDGRTWAGSYVPVQPMIMPLHESISELEVLTRVLGLEQTDAYYQVNKTFGQIAGGYSFDKWLSEGVLPNSNWPKVGTQFSLDSALSAMNRATWKSSSVSEKSLEVRVLACNKLGDGRYNNNGWLQELPEPMSKLTWDNAIYISPKLARELEKSSGISLFRDTTVLNEQDQLNSTTNDFVGGKQFSHLAQLKANGVVIEGPIHIQPGLADYTVIVNTGYGRWETGHVGQGTGFNVYPIVDESGDLTINGASLTVMEKTMLLANTQEHWSMEGRAIIRETNVDAYQKHPDFVEKMGMESHSPPIYGTAKDMSIKDKATQIPRGGSIYKTPDFTGAQQWGMAIDLNNCSGCNACVIACQSENNIPIIGKDQVSRGREMHWMRIDRYYSSGESNNESALEDPQVSFMGMMCQHCELAPCEQVCPVNATVHDEEGLNVMAYNRCVGTRYCANNCPYKVRRFNFFDWNKREIGHFYEGPLGPAGVPETLKMQKNPDVSVRMRGVMEKCTYCVQRIEEAKINQRNKAKDSNNVKVPDGAIVSACQQVCPADAITFGDIADPESKVSKLKENDRNYSVLGYLNIRPRTSYLARVRNPNIHMPDYAQQPLSRIEYEKRFGSESHGAAHAPATSHHS